MDNFSPSKCLKCGKSLHGRKDKKFCDAYCRNSYNNQNKGEEEAMIHEVNRVIRQNRRILRTLCPEGKATVRKDVLDSMGFSYAFISGIFPTSSGPYYFCYEFGFKPILEKSTNSGELTKKVLIVRKQGYMESTPDLWAL